MKEECLGVAIKKKQSDILGGVEIMRKTRRKRGGRGGRGGMILDNVHEREKKQEEYLRASRSNN